jgi:hypothetical protein
VHRGELNLEIPDVLGLREDSILEQIPESYHYNYENYEGEFVYKYEWENTNRGYYLAYRDINIIRGVYIIGEYYGESDSLYDSAKLWLAYPALAGESWTLKSGSKETVMSVVSTNERFYYKDTLSGNISPVRFVDCYLYRQAGPDTTSYYYYNEKLGAVGYLAYAGRHLAKSYILVDFKNNLY